MKENSLLIEQLDQQLKEWQAVQKFKPPRNGWIKTLRQSLSMTGAELARRLKVSRSRLTQLEQGEAEDQLTMRTLKSAAEALGCELVYAIVPKNHGTLEAILNKEAERVAQQVVKDVSHTMALEDQSISSKHIQRLKKSLTKDLSDKFNKKLWSTESAKRSSDKKNKLKQKLKAKRSKR